MQLDNFGGDISQGGQQMVDWARQYPLVNLRRGRRRIHAAAGQGRPANTATAGGIGRSPETGQKTCFRRSGWCPRQDSNLRPSAPEADALSPELRGRRNHHSLRHWAWTA
jgi:hypothetical protein